MSFSRSKVSRFNERKGCAPGVGSYNVTTEAKVSGGAAVAMGDRTQRFREIKDLSMSDINLSKCSSMGELRTPNKSNLAMGHGVERRKKFSSVTTPSNAAENGKIKQLENKIKNLLLQEAEMDRRLQQAQEKADKLDGKLQAAIKEKGQLQAQLARSDKQIMELSRAKDVLRNKVETLENTHNRHNSTSEELEAAKTQLRKKERELEAVQNELSSNVHSLQADLSAAKKTIKALQETKEAIDRKQRRPKYM